MEQSSKHLEAPSGFIEPHSQLLKQPKADQQLYKVMTVENLIRSIKENYLHFNRVDSYVDFLGADSHDGEQPPKDEEINSQIKFEKNQNFSAADYYTLSRSRTYASCFSIKNSDFIWENYAKNSAIGKICIVFNFGKLRSYINQSLNSDNATLLYNGKHCKQIFSINYGLVDYKDWKTYQANKENLKNPIVYTYLKDKKYIAEQELRISLSALGIGTFVDADGSSIDFPESLQLKFDFKAAEAGGAIQKILCSTDCNLDKLKTKLSKLNISMKSGGCSK